MWVIFLIGAFVAALMGIVIVWIGHKMLISIKKDDRKFNMESEYKIEGSHTPVWPENFNTGGTPPDKRPTK